MPKVHAIGSARPLHRTMMDREGHSISLAKGHDFGPGLHAGPLLRQHELAASVILLRLRKQDGHLYGEDVLPVKILMKAIVIAGSVLQEQWSRPPLTRIVTTPD